MNPENRAVKCYEGVPLRLTEDGLVRLTQNIVAAIRIAVADERDRACRWIDALQKDTTSFESASEGIRAGEEPP